MRHASGLVVASLVTGALLGASVSLRRGSSSPPSAPAQEPRAPIPLAAELTQLRARYQQLQAEHNALQARIAAVPVPRAEPCRAPASSTADLAGSAPVDTVNDHASMVERFEATLAGDRSERASAARYEDEVTEFFSAHGPDDVVLEDVACGATLCRIRVEHSSDEARQWFSDTLGQEQFTSGSFVQGSAEGQVSVAYVARKGAEFQLPTAVAQR